MQCAECRVMFLDFSGFQIATVARETGDTTEASTVLRDALLTEQGEPEQGQDFGMQGVLQAALADVTLLDAESALVGDQDRSVAERRKGVALLAKAERTGRRAVELLRLAPGREHEQLRASAVVARARAMTEYSGWSHDAKEIEEEGEEEEDAAAVIAVLLEEVQSLADRTLPSRHPDCLASRWNATSWRLLCCAPTDKDEGGVERLLTEVSGMLTLTAPDKLCEMGILKPSSASRVSAERLQKQLQTVVNLHLSGDGGSTRVSTPGGGCWLLPLSPAGLPNAVALRAWMK
eukprot:COSAG05_NODE_1647_length_4341_cov_1.829797_1_plen_291_part_00